MTLLVRDLLVRAELRLNPLTDPAAWPDVPISWVATTELDDPVPFLRGGELVLTTALRRRTRAQWDVLVEGLVGVPVAAVGIGLGLVHRRAPVGLRDAARRHGLALLASPVEVPFIQISRGVADLLYAERDARARLSAALTDDVLTGLVDGRGVDHLVRLVGRRIGAPIAVSDAAGHVIAASPTPAPWHTTDVLTALTAQDRPSPAGLLALPLRADGVPVGALIVATDREDADVLRPAAALVGLEIARRQAVLAARRGRFGDVVEDVVRHGLSDPEAERRLVGLGIDLDAQARVIVAGAPRAADALRRRPLDLLSLLANRTDPHPLGLVDGRIVALVPEAAVDGVADGLAAFLRPEGEVRVGVGGLHRGVRGLRIGFHEALLAQRQGPGVRRGDTLTLTGLLVGAADLPLVELAEKLLAPVRRHDATSGTALEETLRVYLAHGGSSARAAEALHLHRNSLRHRLGRVEELLDVDLADQDRRTELWLALRVLAPRGADQPKT